MLLHFSEKLTGPEVFALNIAHSGDMGVGADYGLVDIDSQRGGRPENPQLPFLSIRLLWAYAKLLVRVLGIPMSKNED